MDAIFMESVGSALGNAFGSFGQRLLGKFERDVGKCHIAPWASVTNETNDEPNDNDVIASGKMEGLVEEEEVDRREMNAILGSSVESNRLDTGLDNSDVTTGNGSLDVESSELRISNGVSCCHLGANLESRTDSTGRVHHVFEKVNRKSKALEFGLRSGQELVLFNGVVIERWDHQTTIEHIRCAGQSRLKRVSLGIKTTGSKNGDENFHGIEISFNWTENGEFEVVSVKKTQLTGIPFDKNLHLFKNVAINTVRYIEHIETGRYVCTDETGSHLLVEPLQEHCSRFKFRTYAYGGSEDSDKFKRDNTDGNRNTFAMAFKTVEQDSTICRCFAAVDEGTIAVIKLQQANVPDSLPEHIIDGILKTTSNANDTRYFWQRGVEGSHFFESTARKDHFLAVDGDYRICLKLVKSDEELANDPDVSFKTRLENDNSDLNNKRTN